MHEGVWELGFKRRLQTSTSSFEMSSALVGACRFFRSARSEVGDDEEGAVRCLCATGATWAVSALSSFSWYLLTGDEVHQVGRWGERGWGRGGWGWLGQFIERERSKSLSTGVIDGLWGARDRVSMIAIVEMKRDMSGKDRSGNKRKIRSSNNPSNNPSCYKDKLNNNNNNN